MVKEELRKMAKKFKGKTTLTDMELYHLIKPELNPVLLATKYPNKSERRRKLIELAYESGGRNNYLEMPEKSWFFRKYSQLIKEIDFGDRFTKS